MTAYYNEWDAGAAAWLRELIKQGLIADGVVDDRSIIDVSIFLVALNWLRGCDFTKLLAQAPLVSSSFYQEACDKLGKEPIPFLDACSLKTAFPLQFFRDQACVQPQEPYLLHMIRIFLVHLDSTYKTELHLSQEDIFLLFLLCISLLAEVFLYEMLAPITLHLLSCILPNTAIYCTDLLIWGMFLSISCKSVQLQGLLSNYFYAILLCILLSNIFCLCMSQQALNHKQHTLAA